MGVCAPAGRRRATGAVWHWARHAEMDILKFATPIYTCPIASPCARTMTELSVRDVTASRPVKMESGTPRAWLARAQACPLVVAVRNREVIASEGVRA